MSYEQQFLDALKSIFVGAKVEGDSGYINLMKIKATYFEKGVFPRLMKDIDAACKPFDKGFREELFDKLYDFFQHYFSESGSIYFRHTAQHHNIYEKVYTDDRDAMLFWKTHMLYYVKTDRLFKSMEVEVDGETFFFDASGMQLKRANEKRKVIFAFKSIKVGKIGLDVSYSEKGRKTKTDEIIRSIRDNGIALEEETLEKAFRVFEKQSEVDYFINKNAKAFLEEQFDLWMYQYIFKGESDFDASRLKQLQAIKTIAYKTISFIAQFEDELVRIWNKPKFALKSNYIITLDKIAEKDEALLKRILQHDGMKDQLAEWTELGIVDEKFSTAAVLEKDLTGMPLYPQYQYLSLDTKYFSDLELGILALFDDLDATLDGWLIHSDNYQALRTISKKFLGTIKATYIDPPYNSKSTEILYVNNYKSSSWLTILENRLRAGKDFSTTDGSLVVAIDENEQERLGLLLSEIYPDREKICVSVIHNKKGTQGDYFSNNNDYAYFCISPSLDETNGNPIPQEEWEYFNLRKWGKESTRDTAKNCFYPIFVKDHQIIGFGEVCPDSFHPEQNIKRKDGIVEVYPVDNSGTERKWRYARQSVESIIHLLRIKENKNEDIQIHKAKDKAQPKTTWDSPLHIAGDYGTRVLTELGIFPEEDLYPKSIHTVAEAINLISDKSDNILDYFAGSGTTAHAVMNLNRADDGHRKYILVEMGEHFNTVILPRVKKVAFSDKWKDGKAQDGKGLSHFVKYYELEQYEDALRRARYEDAPLFTGTDDVYTSYVFLRDLKLLDAVQIDKKQNKVEVDLDKLYSGIDLAETLSCLTGKWIKRITKDTVEFQDGSVSSLTSPDWNEIKPLIWWQE